MKQKNVNDLSVQFIQSPSDSEPSFRFPAKSENLNIPGNGNRQVEPALPKKIPVVFRYSIGQHKSIKEVYLIGTFTSWKDKVAMAKSDGEFVTIVDLPEGEHQYKFVVDGKWEHDPNQVNHHLHLINSLLRNTKKQKKIWLIDKRMFLKRL